MSDFHTILNERRAVGAFVAADIGKNFIISEEEESTQVYLGRAKELVDLAVEAGVDAVKFQTHEVEDEQLNIDVVSPHFQGSDRYTWVSRNTSATPFEFWQELKEYTDSKGVLFFSTPMSRKAAQKLERLKVPFWKVGSGDVQDHVLLDFLLETKKPIIVASGMVSLAELHEVVNYLRKGGTNPVLLYCISEYPCPVEHFNLGTIEYLKEKYPDLIIGFSDHSIGFEVDLAAVKLGAQIIEKHFSFSRDLWGADHKVSMTPDEMRDMVKAIRSGDYKNVDTTKFYGTKDKELEGATNKFRPYFNKSLMAGTDIKKGDVITKEAVFAMRPRMYAKGLPADRLEAILGKRAKKDLVKFDPLTFDELE